MLEIYLAGCILMFIFGTFEMIISKDFKKFKQQEKYPKIVFFSTQLLMAISSWAGFYILLSIWRHRVKKTKECDDK